MTTERRPESFAELLGERLRGLTEASGGDAADGGGPVGENLGEARRFLDFAFDRKEARVPGGARFGSAKKLLLRMARVFTRPQTEFNAAVLEVLERAVSEFGEQRASLREIGARVDSAEKAVGDLRAALNESIQQFVEQHRSLAEEGRREQEGLAQAQVHGLRELGGHLNRVERALLEEQRARDELSAGVGRMVGRLEELDQPGARGPELREEVDRLSRLQVLESRRIDALGSQGPGPGAEPSPRPARSRAGALSDLSYFEFEDRYRGPESVIRKRQEIYVPFLRELAATRADAGPILDAGCGRGELLEALSAAGVAAIGVDTNGVMVERCRQKGLDVSQEDFFASLDGRVDASLSGFVAAQVVEHLAMDQLVELLQLVRQKLAPGGGLVIETINPESLYAMKFFWHDPTHVRPVPAPTLEALCRGEGFIEVAISYLSPVPEELRPARDSEQGLQRLDDTVFGHQDYALMARAPG